MIRRSSLTMAVPALALISALIISVSGCGGGGGGGTPGGGPTTETFNLKEVTLSETQMDDIGGNLRITAAIETNVQAQSASVVVTRPDGSLEPALDLSPDGPPPTNGVPAVINYIGIYPVPTNSTGSTQQYKVQVKAVSKGGKTVESGDVTFTVAAGPPNPPEEQ